MRSPTALHYGLDADLEVVEHEHVDVSRAVEWIRKYYSVAHADLAGSLKARDGS